MMSEPFSSLSWNSTYKNQKTTNQKSFREKPWAATGNGMGCKELTKQILDLIVEKYKSEDGNKKSPSHWICNETL